MRQIQNWVYVKDPNPDAAAYHLFLWPIFLFISGSWRRTRSWEENPQQGAFLDNLNDEIKKELAARELHACLDFHLSLHYDWQSFYREQWRRGNYTSHNAPGAFPIASCTSALETTGRRNGVELSSAERTYLADMLITTKKLIAYCDTVFHQHT